MANLTVTRTYVGTIKNPRQVRNGLDLLGDSSSKIWNVARWTAGRIWHEIGEIPDEGPLKSYMKKQECWKDLNAQSSQKVIEELSDAFHSWFDVRQKDETMNPPGYRKDGDERPRSTVTFKEDGFKHDAEHNQVRFSKGKNLKDGRSDFILYEYETRPDVNLAAVNTVQNARAVWTGNKWELHLVCNEDIEVDVQEQSPAGKAGIDLGIKNIATVAFPDEYVLYPGNTVKQDKHYFTRAEYYTEGENGPSASGCRRRRRDRTACLDPDRHVAWARSGWVSCARLHPVVTRHAVLAGTHQVLLAWWSASIALSLQRRLRVDPVAAVPIASAGEPIPTSCSNAATANPGRR